MIFKFEMQGKKSGHHRLGLLNLVLTSSCVNYQVLVKFGTISFVCETDSDKFNSVRLVLNGINTWVQLHQHFMRSFYAHRSRKR
jgi:hypothetical protein